MRRISRNLQNLQTTKINLRTLAEKYQAVFHSFPYFNIVQSTVFEDAFYTDKPLVVCAPTGSGKTVIFELCIIRLLMLISELDYNPSKFKIVYMAPVKSLCNERYLDWKSKFEPLGILCIQLTGDSENEDYFQLQKYSLILTTPEKWDCITRLWKNNKVLVQMVKLLLIDEIHLLNEEERGATIEATLSRMKTIQFVLSCKSSLEVSQEPNFRFIAVSATFPNIEDVANWLSTPKMKGVFYKLNDNLRPVCIRKIVIGYPSVPNVSDFKFDLMLSYKLNQVIQTYSENKPTLVFCSTRKSAMQTACILSKAAKFVINASHKALLIEAANRIHESALRECVLNGVGFHHGGLDASDRRMLENMFVTCQLLVLISTSTLSMGVNFPAHLVVIKSTSQYIGGCYQEYSDTQMLQMIGRAGRPQFDRNATAVIMTRSSLQARYESLVNGTQLIESNLHKHMAEHLNAEIVLGSITDISIAMEWLKATYLYQRVFKNPEYYGMSADISKDKIERKLQDICIKELNGLRKYKLIFIDDDSFYLQPTKAGCLMAKYYIAQETMKQFCSITGNENLAEMIVLFSSCKEFDDIHLRVNEKKCLNELNKNKVSSLSLIQAAFGCVAISESSLNQDVSRIFRNAVRVSRCLVEYLSIDEKGFASLHSAVILSKCFKARLWENSKHVSRQLDKIGITFSTLLVNAGITTLEDILNTNPREIELILKRNPPFGTMVIDSAKKIPRYSLQVEQSLPISHNVASICVLITLENFEDIEKGSNGYHSGCYVLIGNSNNAVILFKRIGNTEFLRGQNWSKQIDIARTEKRDEINIYVISDTFVGVDIHKSYNIQFDDSEATENFENEKSAGRKHIPKNMSITSGKVMRSCYHKCIDKDKCSHSCCKKGVPVGMSKQSQVTNFMKEMQNRINDWPSKKVKIDTGTFSENIKIYQNNQFSIRVPQNVHSTFHQNQQSTCSELIILDENDDNNSSAPEYNDRLEEDTTTKSDDPDLENFNFDLNFMGKSDEKLSGVYKNIKEMDNGLFSQNIKKIYQNNQYSNMTPLNTDATFHKNLQSMKASSEAVAFSENYYNDDFTSECKAMLEEVTTKSDESDLENFIFDVNFMDNPSEKCSDVHQNLEQNVPSQRNMKIFQIYPHKINSQSKFKHKIENWDDSEAAEETFNMCLDFLCNDF